MRPLTDQPPMTELRSVSGGTANRAELDDEHRRAAETASSTSAAPAPTARSDSHEHYGVHLLPVVEQATRDFANNALSGGRVPPAFADLGLYTDDALHREIDGAHARLATRPGPEGDGDRLALDRLEREVARRQAPALVDPASLHTFEDAKKSLHAEVTFLGTHGAKLPTELRVQHEHAARELGARHRELLSDARACDDAQPVHVARPSLGGADRVQVVTADDVVAALEQQQGPMTPKQEADARAMFDHWRIDTCKATGTDPTMVVADSHREAKVDTAPRDREMLKMRLDMLKAATTSATGAMAFLDAAARGESLEAAHSRVMLATTLSDFVAPPPPAMVRRPEAPVASPH
ncbi:MAG: hypothetical protein JWP97_4089 [Labilithrix sp.]|nr:hypothetical protein [Labilithrix sp.]